MQFVYVDSSVLAAIMLNESSALTWQAILEQHKIVHSSYLLEAELYAVAARERRAAAEVGRLCAEINFTVVARSFVQEYAQIFALDWCRGADACHLATALYLDPSAKHLRFLTADQRQRRVARALGFAV